MDFQDLLNQPGVSFSNSNLFPNPTKYHDYTIHDLVAGDWYALILSATNQRGASARTLGWKYVVRTFGQLPAHVGPPDS